MQTREHDDADGKAVWLSRGDVDRLLSVYGDEQPRRHLAIQLGLHGLRSNEIVRVSKQDFRRLTDPRDATPEAWSLEVRESKTDAGVRGCPAALGMKRHAFSVANARELAQDAPIVDVTTKTVRNWVADAAGRLADVDDEPDAWEYVTPHDLRRTWGTDTFYSLAAHGVPIAEQLTLAYGGWESARTFRRRYLGPVPDHITLDVLEYLPMIETREPRDRDGRGGRRDAPIRS